VLSNVDSESRLYKKGEGGEMISSTPLRIYPKLPWRWGRFLHEGPPLPDSQGQTGHQANSDPRDGVSAAHRLPAELEL